jgi:hypothetical protein
LHVIPEWIFTDLASELDNVIALPDAQDVMDLMQQRYEEMSEAQVDSPMLDVVTYNLQEVSEFGTPQDFFKELAEMHG